VLRPAVPGDELPVARVHVRAWQIGYRGLLPDAYLDNLRAEDRAPRYTFAAPTPATLVAVDGPRIVGLATTGGDELLALHVDPDHWGRGIGRALIAAARAGLAGAGQATAILWILDGNARADRFYRADGWAPDGEARTATVWGVEVNERRYRRAL